MCVTATSENTSLLALLQILLLTTLSTPFWPESPKQPEQAVMIHFLLLSQCSWTSCFPCQRPTACTSALLTWHGHWRAACWCLDTGICTPALVMRQLPWESTKALPKPHLGVFTCWVSDNLAERLAVYSTSTASIRAQHQSEQDKVIACSHIYCLCCFKKNDEQGIISSLC